MLLLLTIGLVLVGAVALVIGFVTSDQLPIFISIACSIAAGVVLAVFSRMSRRAAAPAAAGGGPAPLVEPTVTATPDLDEVVDDGELVRTQAVPAVGGDGFPIEDYDDLLVSEILPLLPELDLDELDLVRERESQGKNRSSVLKRIDQLLDELEGEAAAEPVAAVDDAVEAAAVAEVVDEPELAAAETSAAGDDSGLAIANYNARSVSEIIGQLDDLSDEELDDIADYEERHANRRMIIDAIDAMFEEGPVEAAPAAAKKATAKKAAAKKSAVKATAKKAAPAKKAVTKASAAKAPAKKAATKATVAKAPAKKAAAKKAAPAKKAASKATKTAAPAKKAAKKR